MTQGDILKDVALYATGKGWEPSNGEARRSPFKMCMVLSRPCAIVHKPTVIVAGVEKLKNPIRGDVDSLEKLLSFLTGLRDGKTSPDVFYLGQIIDGDHAPYAARLDNLHTVELPNTQEVRQAFVESRRIRHLHSDFLRELHIRLFRAVASLGFDDHGWLTDRDLKWLVEMGKKDLAEAAASVHEKRSDQTKQEYAGQTINEKPLSTAITAHDKVAAMLKPYEDEYQRRGINLGAEQA